MIEDPDVLGRPPRRGQQLLRVRVKRYAKIMIVLGTVLLLMGQGEAIYAAPVLVPALWWAARRSGAWARAGITFLAALVMLEVGWFVAYSATNEQQPYITLGPALGFVATIVGFLLTLGPRTDWKDPPSPAAEAPGRRGRRVPG